MSKAHPFLHQTPWPKEKLNHDLLQKKIERLLTRQNMGVLATTGKNGPIASPVEFYAEGMAVWIYPQPGSPKIRAMENDPRVSFAVHMPFVGWSSTCGAQLFGKAQLFPAGTPEFDHGLDIFRWQTTAIELDRDVTQKPGGMLLKIDPDKVVYTEHWLRKDGFAPRQIWRKNA